jgi:Fe2+ or Zn2+ uptake regulation protein
MQRRTTNQRLAVYEAIHVLGHSTSDELIEYLNSRGDMVSLATIYRNLSILLEDGKIKKLKLGTSDVYETVKEKHYHFQCRGCGKIMDIPTININSVSLPKELLGNKIDDHDIVLYGYCSECQKIRKEDDENEKVCM